MKTVLLILLLSGVRSKDNLKCEGGHEIGEQFVKDAWYSYGYQYIMKCDLWDGDDGKLYGWSQHVACVIDGKRVEFGITIHQIEDDSDGDISERDVECRVDSYGEPPGTMMYAPTTTSKPSGKPVCQVRDKGGNMVEYAIGDYFDSNRVGKKYGGSGRFILKCKPKEFYGKFKYGLVEPVACILEDRRRLQKVEFNSWYQYKYPKDGKNWVLCTPETRNDYARDTDDDDYGEYDYK